jgi:hypothetical protein
MRVTRVSILAALVLSLQALLPAATAGHEHYSYRTLNSSYYTNGVTKAYTAAAVTRAPVGPWTFSSVSTTTS